MHAVTAVCPKSTLNSTPTRSSLSGTASYETYIAGQKESGCVASRNEMKFSNILSLFQELNGTCRCFVYVS